MPVICPGCKVSIMIQNRICLCFTHLVVQIVLSVYFETIHLVSKSYISTFAPVNEASPVSPVSGNIKFNLWCLTPSSTSPGISSTSGVSSNKELTAVIFFNNLKASNYPWYKKHLNQHNVIHIMFNENTKRMFNIRAIYYPYRKGTSYGLTESISGC